MAVMKIDITSDVICPFCLIGVKQLTNAIDRYKSIHPSSTADFQLRLLPYQLAANLTETPENREAYYARKFGGAEKASQVIGSMAPRFEEIGYKSDFTGTVSSTHLAHRLQTYALVQKPDQQLSLSMEIFEGFHCHRKDPSDRHWLSSLGVKYGVFPDEKAALDWLNGDGCDVEVRRGYFMAQRLGVTGVPFFVFQDKYAASGAMGEEEFVKLLEEIEKREEANIDPNEKAQMQPPAKSDMVCEGETCS